MDLIQQYLDPLVQYLSTSTSLRNVSFSNGEEDDDDDEDEKDGNDDDGNDTDNNENDAQNDEADAASTVAELLAPACFQNGNIVELKLFSADLPLRALTDLHRAGTSLTKLTINMSNEDTYTAPDRAMIANAFGGFTQLTDLTIKFPDANLGEEILSSLLTIEDSKLTHLALFFTYAGNTLAFWWALVAFLDKRHHQPLQQLSLGFFQFDRQTMPVLIRGLTGPPSVLTGTDTVEGDGTLDAARLITTTCMLRFADCIFDDDAKRLFLELMQTKVIENSSTSAAVAAVAAVTTTETKVNTALQPSSTLQELHFEENMERCSFSATELVAMLSMGREVTDVGIDSEADATATGQDPGAASSNVDDTPSAKKHEEEQYYSTIGSQVKTIFFRPTRRFSGFFALLAESGHRIRLTKLLVSSARSRNVPALIQCIARIPSLRGLLVDSTSRLGRHGRRDLVQAVKENGNLTTVSLEDDAEATKLTRAYCERNQLLDPLLLKSTCTKEADRAGVSESSNASESLTDSCTMISHCPVLLQTAQQTPFTRQSALIRSLMRLQEAIREED